MLILTNIFGYLKYGFSGLCLLIDSIVYWCVCKLFMLFEALAKVEFITQSDYQSIANKFYVIIGIVMLFYLTYSLLKTLINPDDFNKNMGKIVTNLVVSLILIGIVPILFSYAFQVQNAILQDNIIGNLVLGTEDNGEAIQDNSIGKQGGAMTATILSAFLNPGEGGENFTGGEGYTWKNFLANIIMGHVGTEILEDKIDKSISGDGITWEEFIEDASSGNAGAFLNIPAFAEPISNGEAEYLPIISTICGVFLAYVLVSFCIDLGVRVVKLAFYQIIAPIPILMRVIPEKKSVFDNWIKGTLATFMEVFIRLFIMFIVVLLALLILNPDRWSDNGVGFIGNIVVVLGLFAFAKQAPKLISDVSGISSGDIKLGIGGKLKGSGFLGGAIAAAGAGALGFVTGGLGGLAASVANGAGGSGFLYGASNGWKKKGMQFNKQRQHVYSDVLEQMGTAGWFGGRAYFDKKQDNYKDRVKDAYLKSETSKVNAAENSTKFQNIFDELYNKKAKENNAIYQDAYQKFMEKQTQFEKDKMAKIRELQEKYQQEKEAFDTDKFKKLQTLQLQLNKANNENDIVKMGQIQKQIAETQNSTYSKTDKAVALSTQINQKNAEQFHDEKLETIMHNARIIDEAAIRKEAQIAYKKVDSKYKASSTYVAKRAAEKSAKEWRENHAEEAAIQESIYTNAFKNASKEGGSVAGFGGATGGGASSSSSSDSSSGDNK